MTIITTPTGRRPLNKMQLNHLDRRLHTAAHEYMTKKMKELGPEPKAPPKVTLVEIIKYLEKKTFKVTAEAYEKANNGSRYSSDFDIRDLLDFPVSNERKSQQAAYDKYQKAVDAIRNEASAKRDRIYDSFVFCAAELSELDILLAATFS